MAYLTGEVLTEANIAALFTSGTYTPTLTNMAIGTGGTPTNSAKYTFVGFPAGGVLTVEGKIKFGTTAPTLPGASIESISLPSGYSMIETSVSSILACNVQFIDASPAASAHGVVYPLSATTLGMYVLAVSGANVSSALLTATVPFTWAINDEIYYRFVCRCTGP